MFPKKKKKNACLKVVYGADSKVIPLHCVKATKRNLFLYLQMFFKSISLCAMLWKEYILLTPIWVLQTRSSVGPIFIQTHHVGEKKKRKRKRWYLQVKGYVKALRSSSRSSKR